MNDLVIRNGYVVTENGAFYWDIAIKDGKISEIVDTGTRTLEGNKEVDAKGMTIMPGLIDEHTHFDDPGTENEGFTTGSYSLAASGVTTVYDHPIASNPPIKDANAYKLKEEAAKEKCLIDYGLVGGVAADNEEEILKMDQLGAVAFKGFASDNTGSKILRYLDDVSLLKMMAVVAKLNKVLLVHAENEAICSYLTEKNIAEGKTTFMDYEMQRPIESEIEQVRRLITYSKITNCKVHIVHASSKKVVDLVTEAKKEGVDITVETCPHYLMLTVNDFASLNGAKCCPPFRKAEELDPLWECVRNHEIDTIGSDHSSMPLANGQFGGLSGGQSTLPVLLEEGYHKRNIPLETIVSITSTNSAKRFGLYPKKGTIAVGSDADLAFVNLNEEFTLTKDKLFDRQKHSQYLGRTFHGKVKKTYRRGELIFENDEIVAPLGNAKNVTE